MFASAEDRFQHDDRVVHQHPDAQREATEGHDVQRGSGLVHHEEGGHDGDRDRNADDQGAAEVLEEEEQHQDGEEAADQGVVQHFADRGLDEARLVHAGDDLDAFGQLSAHGSQAGLQRTGHLDGVGVTLLVDRQFDGLPATEASDHLTLLVPTFDGGDVADLDLPAAIGDERRGQDVVEGFELVVGANQVARLFFVEAAAGLVHVLAQQLLVDVGDRQAEKRELALVHVDLDLVLVAAADLDRRDALGRLEVLLEHLFRDVTQLVQIGVAGEEQSSDRIVGRIEAQQYRFLRLARQTHRVQLLADVDGGEIHVLAPAELQGYLGQAGS